MNQRVTQQQLQQYNYRTPNTDPSFCQYNRIALGHQSISQAVIFKMFLLLF